MTSYMKKVLLSIIILTAQTGYSDIVLEGSNGDLAFFFVPGAFKTNDSYENLAKELQNQYSDVPNVMIPELSLNFPRKGEVQGKIKEFQEILAQGGLFPKITIIGHSQGGLTASTIKANEVENVILLASYLREDALSGSPLIQERLLSIGGLDDRAVLPERIARDAFRNTGNDNQFFVLLDGVSHFDFADGRDQLNRQRSDGNLERKHQKMAQLIHAFTQDPSNSALKALAQYQKSLKILDGYKKSFTLDDKTCQEAQKMHLGDEGSLGLRYQQINYDRKVNYPRFILDKSRIEESGDTFLVRLPSYYEYRPTVVDISWLQDSYPEVVACKLRSSQAVSQILNQPLANKSCSEINLQVLRQASLLLPESRRTILAQKGFDTDFTVTGEDVTPGKRTTTSGKLEIVELIKDRGEQWALSVDFSLSTKDDNLILNTSSVTTKIGDPSNRFLGAFYCKVLAPSGAFSTLEKLSRK